jgi:hypothetical protein
MTVVPHTVNRLVVQVAGSFDEFRGRFEEAVPQIDPSAIPDFVGRRAPWDEVVAAAAEAAPHGFLIYWTAAATELMALAGDRGSCVSYLMGNHTIAERMYRHDPAVMLSHHCGPSYTRSSTVACGSPSTSQARSSTASAPPRSPRSGMSSTKRSQPC